jgi:MoaA/NifB/PqqE/SkfB family radical SAM enzyme
MCDIWKKTPNNELTLEQIRQIFNQLRDLDAIKITGGEPFIRTDLTEIVNLIQKKNHPRVLHITSNGLLTERIVNLFDSVEKVENIHLKISLDAAGEKHDRIRGVNGAYKKVLNTLEELTKLRKRRNFYLGVDQTLIDYDSESARSLLKLCRRLGVGFHQAIAYDKGALLREEDELSLLPDLPGGYRTLKELSPKELKGILETMEDYIEVDDFYERVLQKYYLNGLKNRLLFGKSEPKPNCVAMRTHLRILPNGDIPICVYDTSVVGNLTKEKLADIWFGEKIKRFRRMVDDCKGCWIPCEIVPNSIYTGDILWHLF